MRSWNLSSVAILTAPRKLERFHSDSIACTVCLCVIISLDQGQGYQFDTFKSTQLTAEESLLCAEIWDNVNSRTIVIVYSNLCIFKG